MNNRGGLNPQGGFDIRRLLPQNPFLNVNPMAAAMPIGTAAQLPPSTLNVRTPQTPPAYADGGKVMPAAKLDGGVFVRAATKAGLPDDMNTLNQIVNLVNRGYQPDQAAMMVAQQGKYADGGMVPTPPSAAPPQAGMAPQQPGLASPGGAAPQRMSLQQLQQEAQKFAQANPQAVQMIREALMEGVQDGDVTPQQITMMVQMAVAAAQNPDLYPRLRQMAIQQGLADEEDLPMQYDQGLVFSLIVAGAAMQQGGQAMAAAPQVPGAQAPAAMMKEGGHIPMTRSPTGDNTGRADDIPIRVSGGEYVIPKHIVERKGTEFFDKLIGKDKGAA